MGLWELFIIAVGLSMDAFAVAICKGLSAPKIKAQYTLITGLYFGVFQAVMPLIGYFCGSYFEKYIVSYDHWVVFALLALIGGNMIKESLEKEEGCGCCSFGPKEMFPLAVATSIDALAVGITFALLKDVNIGAAVGFIGIITFVLSAAGVYVGHFFGAKYKSKAEFLGGVVLIAIGIKILLEHLGVI